MCEVLQYMYKWYTLSILRYAQTGRAKENLGGWYIQFSISFYTLIVSIFSLFFITLTSTYISNCLQSCNYIYVYSKLLALYKNISDFKIPVHLNIAEGDRIWNNWHYLTPSEAIGDVLYLVYRVQSVMFLRL